MTSTADPVAVPATRNLVNGEWQPSLSGRTYAKYGPWKPHEKLGDFPASDKDDVALAVEAAAAAFPRWAGRSPVQRGAVLMAAADDLERRADEIARDMSREMGKPRREARLEAQRCAAIFRFFGSEGWRPSGERFAQSAGPGAIYTLRRPLGVVGLITPWNFPAAIPAWKIAPALTYGNTVVMKVAQEAPLTALHIAAALSAAGAPPGVFNLLIGRGSEVGTPLVRHPLVRAISFTGSGEVGNQVRADATALGKQVQLELGGQNALIVTADADVARATEAAFLGAFASAGQKCTATRRIYVEEAVYSEFKAALLARTAKASVGDPSLEATEVGPVVNEKQMTEIMTGIERGKREGGIVLTGGTREHDEAYLLAPTVFEHVADDHFLSCEEVFGPVVSLYPFSDLADAVERANSTRFGLSASIFTGSLAAARLFVNEIQAGVVHVNSQTAGTEVHVPFGGTKESGFGPHEQGRSAREFFTELVTVYEDV